MYYTIQPKENGFSVKKEILGKRIFYLEKNLSSYVFFEKLYPKYGPAKGNKLNFPISSLYTAFIGNKK